MRRTLPALLAALTVVAAVPAAATTRLPRAFTCPVGGEQFQDYVIGSYTSWGSRPDGQPYGTLPWVPIPECPGNGFLLFRQVFTPEEIAILTPLVASAEYQAMRTGETMHYRAWWLQRALGTIDPAALAQTLLVASWQSDDAPERKARYQRAFIAATATIPADDPAWLMLTLRAANARRELGDFAAAAAGLQDAQARDAAWPRDRDERAAAQAFATGLAAEIAERNSAPEPVSLIPLEVGAERCAGKRSALSVSDRKICATPPYVAAMAERAAANKRLRGEPLVWDEAMTLAKTRSR